MQWEQAEEAQIPLQWQDIRSNHHASGEKYCQSHNSKNQIYNGCVPIAIKLIIALPIKPLSLFLIINPSLFIWLALTG